MEQEGSEESSAARVAPRGRHVRLALVVFLTLLYGYSYNGAGWNHNARYDPIFAFVEAGPAQYSFQIDAFISDPKAGRNTGDWAFNPNDQHYYSNKAPGTTLLGVPVYFVLYHAERALGGDPQGLSLGLANAYLLHLFVTVLPMALSALAFFVLVERVGSGRDEAIFLTLCLYVGTLALPFSTQLWGHTTAMAFGVFALRAALEDTSEQWVACGALAGCGVLTDYGALVPAVALAVFLAVRHGRRGTLAVSLGALAPALVFFGYHAWCFDSPFALASTFSNPIFLDADRVGKIFGGVDPQALWSLTLSPSRGLLPYMPILLLAPVGAAFAARAGERQRVILCLAVALGLLVANASFNGWRAGLSFGPRYQIVALPFWILLLAGLWRRPRFRSAGVVLLLISSANMLLGSVVTAFAPSLQKGYMALLAAVIEGGHPSMNVLRIDRFFAHASLLDPFGDRASGAFNLGELLGLTGLASLAPLLGLVLAFGAGLLRRGRRVQSSAEVGKDFPTLHDPRSA